MAKFVEERKIGIRGFEILLKPQFGQAREIAEAFGPDQRIIRHILGQDDAARFGKLRTKGAPGAEMSHAATQSPPFTSSMAPVISLA